MDNKEAEVIINFHILLLFEKVMIVKQICFEFDTNGYQKFN
jgi:hypothetical protein